MNNENKFLKVPLTLTLGSLERTSLKESISQFVGIIISSRLGSFPFDSGFGCKVWDSEYTYFSKESVSEFSTHLRNAISKTADEELKEERLKLEEVSPEIVQDFKRAGRNKTSLIVKVKGKYIENGVEDSFEEEYVFWQPPWSEEIQR